MFMYYEYIALTLRTDDVGCWMLDLVHVFVRDVGCRILDIVTWLDQDFGSCCRILNLDHVIVFPHYGFTDSFTSLTGVSVTAVLRLYAFIYFIYSRTACTFAWR